MTAWRVGYRVSADIASQGSPRTSDGRREVVSDRGQILDPVVGRLDFGGHR